jgi:FkbM family methyltransferase
MAVAGKFINEIFKVFDRDSKIVILDVGSRDLDESIELSQAFPNAKIIAFEPNPNQFPICQERSLQYPNIQVHQYACSDEEGTLDFYVVDNNHGASSLLEPIHIPGDWSWSKTTVEVKRIDTVLNEIGIKNVDVVWMDVQGIELKALKGMGSFINDVKLMHTEACPTPYYKGHILKDELETWIRDQGFDLYWEPSGHMYGESDILCIRK